MKDCDDKKKLIEEGKENIKKQNEEIDRLKEELTDKDIMAIRFTSSQKSILIKLVLLDSDEFLNLFDIIKKKLTKE